MIAAILVATPISAATWMSYGQHEPDNAEDSEDFLFFDPPGAETDRVYFNGWTSINGGANPNVGALSTRNEVPTAEIYSAILGVWADCNGDGYVGLIETAVREYDARLLLDTSICPPTVGAENAWDGSFNYNGWVSEFIPIGGSGGTTNADTADDERDLRIIRDQEAHIWADFGVWHESAASAQGTCALTPQPRGTYQSTGGILNFIECSPGLLERWNQIFRDGFRVLGTPIVGGLDPNNERGLHWTNDDNANQPGHPLSMPTLGSEHSDNSPAYLSDCSADPFIRVGVGDVINGSGVEQATGRDINQSDGTVVQRQPVAPRAGNTNSATIPGTVNMTAEEGTGNCNYKDDNGGDVYEGTCQVTGSPCVGEGSFEGSSNSNKISARLNFAFSDFARGKRGVTGLNNTTTDNLGLRPLDGVFPNDGYGGVHNSYGRQGGDWAGGVALIKTTGPRAAATNLDNGTVDIARAYFMSYFAHVGEGTTSFGVTLPGGSGVYGLSQCGSETTGIHQGWNCDKNAWYREQNTGNVLPGTDRFARPGTVYELRDVDCHDGGNSLGVPLGVPALGARACAAP